MALGAGFGKRERGTMPTLAHPAVARCTKTKPAGLPGLRATSYPIQHPKSFITFPFALGNERKSVSKQHRKTKTHPSMGKKTLYVYTMTTETHTEEITSDTPLSEEELSQLWPDYKGQLTTQRGEKKNLCN